MSWPLFLYALIVLALLIAELRENRLAQIIFKPLAALGFVALALYFGAMDSLYGKIILGGLIACALGDVLLLSRNSEKLFMVGMGAFALGHILYIAAFRLMQSGQLTSMTMISGALAAFAGLAFFIWLRGHLPKAMRWAVLIYSTIIILMVVRALGLPWEGSLKWAMIGALMFAVSDMFVARDRFVKRDPKNALAITPLYFGAQALFALSVQMSGV